MFDLTRILGAPGVCGPPRALSLVASYHDPSCKLMKFALVIRGSSELLGS